MSTRIVVISLLYSGEDGQEVRALMVGWWPEGSITAKKEDLECPRKEKWERRIGYRKSSFVRNTKYLYNWH